MFVANERNIATPPQLTTTTTHLLRDGSLLRLLLFSDGVLLGLLLLRLRLLGISHLGEGEGGGEGKVEGEGEGDGED